MRWFTETIFQKGLARLGQEEKGAVAVVVALLLTGILGLAAASIDLGVLYSTHGELQNAADAAALAGANTLLTLNEENQVVAAPDEAQTTAKSLAWANLAQGVSLDLPDQDIEMGFWDGAVGDFDPDRYGPSGNPDDLTAVRVLVRRDDTANSPVGTVLAGIVGVEQVSLNASSTAFLGYAGTVEEGQVDLPIAIDQEAVSNGSGPICDTYIEFHSTPNQNGYWTTFFTWPTNDPNVKKYINGTYETPALEVGDVINTINGNLSNNTFYKLAQRFQTEGEDTNGDGAPDYWPVILPVVNTEVEAGSSHGCGCSTRVEVTGFATMIITGVNFAPYKNVQGYLQCGMGIPNSQTGGENFGTRATFAKLIQ